MLADMHDFSDIGWARTRKLWNTKLQLVQKFNVQKVSLLCLPLVSKMKAVLYKNILHNEESKILWISWELSTVRQWAVFNITVL
jgi:hypothetical protein